MTQSPNKVSGAPPYAAQARVIPAAEDTSCYTRSLSAITSLLSSIWSILKSLGAFLYGWLCAPEIPPPKTPPSWSELQKNAVMKDLGDAFYKDKSKPQVETALGKFFQILEPYKGKGEIKTIRVEAINWQTIGAPQFPEVWLEYCVVINTDSQPINSLFPLGLFAFSKKLYEALIHRQLRKNYNIPLSVNDFRITVGNAFIEALTADDDSAATEHYRRLRMNFLVGLRQKMADFKDYADLYICAMYNLFSVLEQHDVQDLSMKRDKENNLCLEITTATERNKKALQHSLKETNAVIEVPDTALEMDNNQLAIYFYGDEKSMNAWARRLNNS